MEYFTVTIEGSTAAYQEFDEAGNHRFTDANGNTVASPDEPIHYQHRESTVDLLPWMG